MRSSKITNLSFLLALGIVWQHSRLLQIPETVFCPSFLTAMQITNRMMDVVVPCFFFISGYLFYLNYTQKDYLRKLHTRIRSLLVPYLLWNTIFAILWYAVVRWYPEYVSDHFSFDGFRDVFTGIILSHYSVLWYVGVIFVYALLAPLIWQMVYRKKVFFCVLPLLCVVCVVFRHPFCSPILWLPLYSAGAYVGIHHKDFLFREQPVWLTWCSFLLFPLFFSWDFLCTGRLSMNAVQWVGPTLCMGLYDFVNRRFPIAPQKIFKYSFFLYALHYLPVHVGQRVVLSLGDSPWLPYLAYFGVPALTVLLAIVVSVCMDRYAHSLYSLLSGGR